MSESPARTRARVFLNRASTHAPTLCLVFAGVVVVARLVWDAAAAFAFTGLSAKVAELHNSSRTAQALELLVRESDRYPATGFASAIGCLQEGIGTRLVDSCRASLRQAAQVEGEGRMGDAWRLYSSIERTAPIASVAEYATRSKARISRRREEAEAHLQQGRALELAGDREGAFESYIRVLSLYPETSAAHDLKVPLRVVSEPTGARLFVDGEAAGATPGWIQWPVRPGARLRLESPQHQPLELTGIIRSDATPGGRECTLRVSLEPRRLWLARESGGALAGGRSATPGLIVVAGSDGLVRGLSAAPATGGPAPSTDGQVRWERFIEGDRGVPASGLQAFCVGEEILVFSSRGLATVLRGPAGDVVDAPSAVARVLATRLALLLPLPIAERAALWGSRLHTLSPDGTLESWDLSREALLHRRSLATDLTRVCALEDAVVLAGPNGRIVLLDATGSSVHGEMRVAIPGEVGQVSGVFPVVAERGGELDGPLVVVGESQRGATIYCLNPSGSIRWRSRFGAIRGVTLSAFAGTPDSRRLFVSAPGRGTLSLACP